ncbi:MAG TPA: hypothetical protein VK116_11985, partial [Planctomycetota bacterium]|nr:hypothetical protein [Planctomycetota bacterium]
MATADPASPSANAAIQASTDMAMQAPPNIAREGLGSFDDGFAEAKAIVVATALDSTQAPPRRPGDLPENNIRFRVKRVIKGDLDQKEIFTRTPTAAAEFIGKDWIVVLSPDF